jgi:hypothetical protein
VYYINEVLHDAKMRYLEVHKLLYAVLIVSRKLHDYFQANKISMFCSYSLRAMLHNPNATGNIAKWAVELVEFELDFPPNHVVRSQVLADFMVDWAPRPCHPGGLDDGEPEPRAPVFIELHWTLFFNGSSWKQGAGVRVLLLTPIGEQFMYLVHLDFKATNNMTEYDDLIFGQSIALSLGVQQLLVKDDSKLVIMEVKEECSYHDA